MPELNIFTVSRLHGQVDRIEMIWIVKIGFLIMFLQYSYQITLIHIKALKKAKKYGIMQERRIYEEV